MTQMHQFILDCGATFTDELYKLTRLSFSPFSNAKAERKRLAEINIKANCTRPAEPPAAPADRTADGCAAVNRSGRAIADNGASRSAGGTAIAARRAACGR